MSIKNKYKVKSIAKHLCNEWLLHKHYAKRIPSISYAFGLFNDNNLLVGVCTYGYPPNYNYNNGACVFNKYRCLTLELNRLIKNDDLEKNTTSFFVSETLKKLPKNTCIVSYADPNEGHNGYIYQSTNWVYTGTSTPKHRYYFKDGTSFDIRRGIHNKGEVIKKELLKPTHRYLYFIGSKKDIRNMKKDLKMDVKKYPKGNNKRYDTTYKPTIQTQLFL